MNFSDEYTEVLEKLHGERARPGVWFRSDDCHQQRGRYVAEIREDSQSGTTEVGRILKNPEETGYIQDAGPTALEAAREEVPPGRNRIPMKAHPAATEPREVMDIRQAADYLGISADTLYKYASEGFVPAFKLGNRWRFKRSRLNDWMDQQSTGGHMPAVKEEKAARAKAKKPVESVRPGRRKSATQ
jgi:excisionase family DNA binding protein